MWRLTAVAFSDRVARVVLYHNCHNNNIYMNDLTALSNSEPVSAPPRSYAPLRPLERSAARKILLVEDDRAFQEIMRDFLTESGFTVVAVQNGVEGVHEVLASDFEVVLCDMMMPTLPGDMFYRAVERMRPHLCDRFIFMTGHRGNDKAQSFVKKVNGPMLNKPFQVDDLLDMIAFVEVRAGTEMAA
jgi:CheY-like chemotaxis protein